MMHIELLTIPAVVIILTLGRKLFWFFVSNLIAMGGWQIGQMFWLLALIGGIIGALTAYHFFDWALIILSASTGAAIIGENLGPGAPLSIVVLAVLLIVGVAVQVGLMQRDRSKSSPK